jgi:hypothetical protein
MSPLHHLQDQRQLGAAKSGYRAHPRG